MATLVFGAIGTALGGPLGGAIGALAGRQVDSLVLGRRERAGPRLRELEVSLSSYGLAIPRIHGRMRVPGAIIWATELQESSELLGSGKGQPTVRAYSYAANLAVALSSRPILRLGRIWADGKLLRGAAGDLKVGGTLRVHTGAEDQPVDSLIAASEGEALCPAFRGLAYAVFEGLELAEFGNRLPALTFEVVADEAVDLATMLGEMLPGCEVRGGTTPLAGLTVEDTLGDSLAALAPVLPLAIDAGGPAIVVHAGQDGAALLLGEAAAAGEDDAFAPAMGHLRRRAPPEPQPPAVLRYLDVDRDFQPGTQHASTRAGPGQPELVELPAALDGGTARKLVEAMVLRRDRARETLLWRTCTLDPAIMPGARVRLPGHAGTWQVQGWEWREAGIELELARMAPGVADAAQPAAPPFPAPPDLLPGATRVVAFELPWDPGAGMSDRPRPVAAVCGTGGAWNGAALYADHGDGQLLPLGHSSRAKAVVGTVVEALAPAGPLLLDRTSHVTVALAGPEHGLASASLAQLANGANLALIGEELVQFARAEPLGDATWRLSHLLRGCGGTERAIATHAPGEPFALVDARLTPLDPQVLGGGEATLVVALGRGDHEPVAAPLRLAGIGARPLAPVHPRAEPAADGVLRLGWTRRARGGWRWVDGIDVPLGEEAERYVVTLERGGATLRTWTVTAPAMTLSPADLALLPPGSLRVRQQGTHALSLALDLAELT